MRKLYLVFFLFFFIVASSYGKSLVYDSAEMDVMRFFTQKNTCYVIQNAHSFNEELTIPEGCELIFEGGRLSGKICFIQTKLKGSVDLRGSSIRGTIKNNCFNASWICHMDGETDDAPCINEILDVCGRIYFPKGRYRLVSAFDPVGRVPKGFESKIKTHIGICRNKVSLVGEEGTVFITNKPLGVICLISQPNQIQNSINNVLIKKIEFKVENDGKSFYDLIHTIKIMGVNGLRIENCYFNDFWGDAICLSHYGDNPQTGERTRNQNIKILNNTIVGGVHYSNRNGISVISGKNVLIKWNTIKNTSRKDMPGGIDVEPNNSAYVVENIRIEKNVLDGIKGGGGAISVVSPKGSPAHRIYIIGNTVTNSETGVFVYLKSDNSTDTYYIMNNHIDYKTRPYRFEGSGVSSNWIISGNTFDRPCTQDIPGDIRVKNLVIKNNKKKE